MLTRMLAGMETVLWKYLNFEHFRKEGKESQLYQLASLSWLLGSALDPIHGTVYMTMSGTDTIMELDCRAISGQPRWLIFM